MKKEGAGSASTNSQRIILTAEAECAATAGRKSTKQQEKGGAAMGIKLNVPYEKRDIGQLLEELGKNEKWRSCVVTIQTTLPNRYRQTESVYFHNLQITDFRRVKARFELVLKPTKEGFLPIQVQYFFWPGEKDEQDKGGLKKPILSISVLGAPGFFPKFKDFLRRIFGK